MSTKLKTLTALAVASALSGCGGGGGGGGGSATLAGPTVLKTFSDGAGIGVLSSGGYTSVAMAPNIQSITTGTTESAVDTTNLSYNSSNLHGDFYTGSVVVNGVQVSTTVFVDSTSGAGIVYAFNTQSSALIAVGQNVSNIPSGSYTYVGTNALGRRDGTYSEVGTFAMTVNFSAGTAAISGQTSTSTIGGTGISVNSTNGTFQGTNLNISLNGASPISGSIYGSFFGSGATGVGAIYSDNNANPTYAGAIAGHR